MKPDDQFNLDRWRDHGLYQACRLVSCILSDARNEGCTELTRQEECFSTVFSSNASIKMGGLEALFDRGYYLPHLIECYTKIQALEHANLLEWLRALFPHGVVPVNAEDAFDYICELDEGPIGTKSKQWWGLEQSLWARLVYYWRENESLFTHVP